MWIKEGITNRLCFTVYYNLQKKIMSKLLRSLFQFY